MAVLKAKASGFKCEKGYPWLESYWIRMKKITTCMVPMARKDKYGNSPRGIVGLWKCARASVSFFEGIASVP